MSTTTPDVVAWTCALVGRPSITPFDSGCQAWIHKRLAPLGFTAVSLNHHGITNTWWHRGLDREGPHLGLFGHTDVVPPGPLALWQSDPFVPELRDGCLYGRGAVDMKGNLAAALVALHQHLPERCSVVLTSDEEGPAVHGTAHVLAHMAACGGLPDVALVLEPSSHRTFGDVVRVGRRGSFTVQIRWQCSPQHAAYPVHTSALEAAAALVGPVAQMAHPAPPHPFVPTTGRVVALKSDEGAYNVLPGHAEAVINWRYAPSTDAESLLAGVRALLAAQPVASTLTVLGNSPPYHTQEASWPAWVQQVLQKTLGQPTICDAGGGTSDGRMIAPWGVPVVELGIPNHGAHASNEGARVSELERAVVGYAAVFASFGTFDTTSSRT